MENKEQTKEELIRRYIYDVVRRLPQNQRGDIERELMANIQDALDARACDGEYTMEDVRAVLNEMGTPMELAASYMDYSRALISGDYYDKYLFILKIVLPMVVIGLTIAYGIGLALTPGQSVLTATAEFISNLIFGTITAFAFVTFFFALFERAQVKFDTQPWSLDSLQPIPQERAIIKRGEHIASIVFIMAALLFFNLAPQHLGVAFIANGTEIEPLFNLTTLYSVLPLLNLLFALGILREIICVIVGRYTLRLAIIVLVMNIIGLAIALSIFTSPNIWNYDILHQFNIFEPDAQHVIRTVFVYFFRFFPFILVFAYVLDTATTLYKGIRYGRAKALN